MATISFANDSDLPAIVGSQRLHCWRTFVMQSAEHSAGSPEAHDCPEQHDEVTAPICANTGQTSERVSERDSREGIRAP